MYSLLIKGLSNWEPICKKFEGMLVEHIDECMIYFLDSTTPLVELG